MPTTAHGQEVVRVRHLATGAHLTVSLAEYVARTDAYRLLKSPALDSNGLPARAKYPKQPAAPAAGEATTATTTEATKEAAK